MHCLDARRESQLHAFVSDLAGILSVPVEPTASFLEEMQQVNRLASGNVIGPGLVRQACLEMADEYDDFYLFPPFLDPSDRPIAFVDNTDDYSGVDGVAITPWGIVWRNNPPEPICRLDWAEVAPIRADTGGDQVLVGKGKTIDLSGSSVEPSILAELLRRIVKKTT